MPATVEAAFRLINRSKGSMDEIKRDATVVTAKTKEMGSSADTAARKYETSMDRTKRATSGAVRASSADLDKLLLKLKEVEHTRANAKVDVDITAAEAKLRILRQEIRKVSTAEARKELTDLGLVADTTTTKLAGGGGGRGGGGGGLAAGFAAAGGRAIFMGAAVAAAAPAIVALGGSISALIGSLAMAAGGAGVAGTGLLGAAAVGFGSIAAVAVPTMNRLKQVKKDQDAYNKAVQQYGDASSQAIKAHNTLNAEFAKTPGSRQLFRNLNTLQTGFRARTQPAQGNFIGVLNDSLGAANRLMPEFAQISNSSMGAARHAWQGFLAVLSNREAQMTWRTLGQMFHEDIGPFARGVGNIAVFFERIARASRPGVREMFDSFDNMTSRLASQVSNTQKTGNTVGRMMDQLHAWMRLFGAAGRLAVTFFTAGQTQGKSLVQSMTDQLNRWSDWLERNPAKVQNFFDQAISSTKALGGALANIAGTLFQISSALMPVLQGFSALTGAMPPSLMGALGIMAGGRFVAGKFGRAFGGGAAGAGGTAAAEGAAAAAATGTAATATRGGGILAGARGALGRIGSMSAGDVAAGVGKAALRKVGPLALAFAAYDFLTTQGSIGNRLGAVANGALFGIPNMLGAHLGQAGPTVSGAAAANQFLRTPANNTVGAISSHMNQLRRQLGARTTFADVTGNITVMPRLRGDARRRVQDQLNALKPTLNVAINTRTAQQLGDLQQAFQIRESRLGERGARRGLFAGLRQELSHLGPQGRDALLRATASWTSVLQDGTKKQKRTARDLVTYIEHQYRAMGQNVQVVNGNIEDGTRKSWQRIQAAMSSQSEQALEQVTKNFTAIQREAVGDLVAMGFSRSEARQLVRGIEQGGSVGSASRNAINIGAQATHGIQAQGRAQAQRQSRRARGGRLSGIGNSDYLNVGGGLAAPNELIVNRHTERRADAKLGRRGALAALVAGEHVPNSMNVSTYAYGGVTPGLAKLITRLDHIGFHHGSTTGGGHAPNSFHFRGEAVDYGDANNNMERLWRVVYPMRRQFAELFGPANMTPGPTLMHNGVGFNDPALQAQHNNHIHIALANAMAALGALGAGGAGGGMVAPQLRRRQVRGRGVPGALAQASVDAIRTGIQNNLSAAMGGAGGGVGGGGGTSGANQTLGKAMMIAAGWPASEWPALKALWTRESGWNANAVNPSSGAMGIPQALGHGNVFHLGDARAQIAWGLNYIRGRYGSPSAAWQHERSAGWYARGGRVPNWGGWFGNGGAMVAGQPTLIGVGERGQRERVTVTRESGGTGFGAGSPIQVHIGTVHYHGKGDLKKAIEDELREVARSLDRHPLEGSEL
jgi:hypothetical protein